MLLDIMKTAGLIDFGVIFSYRNASVKPYARFGRYL